MKLLVVTVSLIFMLNAHAKISSEENAEPSSVKNALQQVKSQIKKLEQTVNLNKDKEKDLNKQLIALENDITSADEQAQKLEETIANHEQTLQNLQKESIALKKSNQMHQEALSQFICATFAHYQKQKLQLILEQNDWSVLARLDEYYRHFYDARAKQIETLQNLLKKIQAVENEIQTKKQTIETMVNHLKAQQVMLAEKKQMRTSLLAKLAKERQGKEQQLTALQQQESELTALFKKLNEKAKAAPEAFTPSEDFAKMKKHLILPIQDSGAKLTVLPHLKSAGRKSYIAAPTGTPVNAVFAGKVVFAEWLRGVGMLMIIDHGHGYMSLYGNNEKLYKSVGDSVATGEMIARVGQSGGHSEPGLYFEIRKGGEALDPAPWFERG